MAIHYKNPQTGKYEAIKIPVMKGEQGHAGIHVGTDVPATTDIKLWFDPSDTENDVDLANRLDSTLTACYDYMGNDRGSIKKAADANVDFVLGEINTAHYEGQQITATNTLEGRCKSAILKGQTLVNLVISYSNSDGRIRANINGLFESNRKYLIRIIDNNFTVVRRWVVVANADFQYTTFSEDKPFSHASTRKYNQVMIDVKKDDDTLPTTEELSNVKVMVFEYRDGMENWDIPYFEGMQSVKMPVLSTCGKNLFDGETERGFIDFDTGNNSNAWGDLRSVGYAEVIGGNKINIYVTNSSWASPRIFEYDKAKKFIKSTGEYSVVLDNATKFVRFNIGGNTDVGGKSQVMLYYGEANSSTTYEPYKTNILSCNEEVTLRGIGEVKDTLDLTTGELTQRIGEIVLDGSEDESWTRRVGGIFTLTLGDKLAINRHTNTNCICDKLKASSYSNVITYGKDRTENLVCVNSNVIGICLKELETTTELTHLIEFLSQNPITLHYELEEPIVKTVDLSDNVVYSYKDATHYTCSSEDESLVPTLSVDVPTNLSALVTQQRKTITSLEQENKALANELNLAIETSEFNDNELLAQSFELDFRLMEIEFALDLPLASKYQLGVNTMAMTPYDMAKKLILAGNYDRADMERKLETYVSRKRMSEEERQELIDLMDEQEKEDEIVDLIEPEFNPEDVMVLPSFE